MSKTEILNFAEDIQRSRDTLLVSHSYLHICWQSLSWGGNQIDAFFRGHLGLLLIIYFSLIPMKISQYLVDSKYGPKF